MSAPGPQTRWVSSLSPWPPDGFDTGRMEAVLRDLGDPQDAYPAVHVVGTNGKSTATVVVEALLRAEGLHVGTTISPHIRGWAERIRLDGRNPDIEEAIAAVRPAASRHSATQFETVTAAALAVFAAAEVDVAVVEAGLGGRLDATNVLRSRVVLLTNVGLDHTDVLGDTRERIAAEKLAVVHGGETVVLPDLEFAGLVPGTTVVVGGAREAAGAFLGRPAGAEVDVSLPGRLEIRDDEVRDGAHNPDGARWLVRRLPPARYVICASILRDKAVDEILRELARVGETLVATESSNARSLGAYDLATRARSVFEHVEAVADPADALARAHELGEPVLVTGSLYLLAELAAAESCRAVG